MSTLSHEPPSVVRERPLLLSHVVVREMWASVAITAMWVAVVVDAIFGPDIVNTTASGDSSTVPSAVVLALFAFLSTWVVARYGLRERK